MSRKMESTKKGWIIVIIALSLLSLITGFIGAFIFARSGPQGPIGLQGPQGIQGLQGEIGSQGIQGEQGLQGLQGESGLNGTDNIQQVLQSLNSTAENIGAYSAAQWLNMSIFDSSMRLTVNVDDQSRILVEFISSVYLSNSEVRFRVIVDNQYASTISYTGLIGPSSPNDYDSIQVKLLTNALSAGQHTIDVQFYLVSGSPTVLDRSLFVTELSPP